MLNKGKVTRKRERKCRGGWRWREGLLGWPGGLGDPGARTAREITELRTQHWGCRPRLICREKSPGGVAHSSVTAPPLSFKNLSIVSALIKVTHCLWENNDGGLWHLFRLLALHCWN